jgi:hypothetical protein
LDPLDHQVILFIDYQQVKHSISIWDAMKGKAPKLKYTYKVIPQTSVQFKKYIELTGDSKGNTYDIKYM